MDKGVVLLSGGMDSVVSLAMAREKLTLVKALTFDYGQQAAKNEIEAAAKIAQYYHVDHLTVSLPWLSVVDKSALQAAGNVPKLTLAELDDTEITRATARSVWVPNRNGLFINIAACFAESLNAGVVIAGFNAEEAETFPDNSIDFVQRANDYFAYATLNRLKVWAPTQILSKKEIAQAGAKLEIPWQYVWSCYAGGEKMCGRCESCRRLYRALREAKVNYAGFMD